jgi:tripartite-type tricarboxylate transporter receptor subunit TctC
MLRLLARTFGTTICLLSIPALARAQTEATTDLFKGKTISLYIGTGAGGLFDLYGRLVATHLADHLPGHPIIVVQNMPGAGGVRMANQLFNQVPKDGTVIGLPLSTLALLETVSFPGVQYHTSEFTWFGRVSTNTDITVSRPGKGPANVQDARKVESIIAGATNGSNASIEPLGLNAFAGTKFKVISGYNSSSEGLLAFDRGEVDGASTSWDTLKRTRKQQLNEGKVKVIVQYGTDRHPEMLDVPASAEFGETAADKQLLGIYAPGAMLGTALAGPPGMSPAVTKAYRQAFDAMLQDPLFRQDVERSGNEFNHPVSGTDLQDLLTHALSLSDDVRQRAKAAFK